MAQRFGISRVTDTTRLDRIGIPVYASVRPTAVEGSLCVSAGKGVRAIEAQVGAYMEAIELAVAEPGGPHREVGAQDPRDLLGGRQSGETIADLCPVPRRGIDLAAAIDCVEAEDLVRHANVMVPAELVFLPYVPRSGVRLFGSSSNGLASGNTIADATLHGLLEVIERDVRSFNLVRNTCRRIANDSIRGVPQELLAQIHAAGFLTCVRTLPNSFDIPLFEAHIFDPASLGPLAIASGFGCQVVSEIALTRAITEAVQSRLTAIHGARDDMIRDAERAASREPGELERVAATWFQGVMDSRDVVTFDDVAVGVRESSSIDDTIDATVERLLQCGIQRVCRVILTGPHEELHVVRMIVPKLEFFRRDLARMGPRLLGYVHGQLA